MASVGMCIEKFHGDISECSLMGLTFQPHIAGIASHCEPLASPFNFSPSCLHIMRQQFC